jgi:hypothetical protein
MIRETLILSSGSNILNLASLDLTDSVVFFDPITEISKFIRGFITKMSFKLKLYFLKKILPDKKFEDVVIFDSIFWERNIDVIKVIYPKARLTYYYWNKIDCRHNPKKMIEFCHKVASFDIAQSAEYCLNYDEAFSPIKLDKKQNKTSSCDIAFVGMDKGRKRILDLFCSHLQKNQILYNFKLIVAAETIKSEYYNCSTTPISYIENVSIIDTSKCILELAQEGQTGMTVRVMEAIFLRKKIITNNYSLKEHPLYHSNNIYFFNPKRIDLSDLRMFIDKDYKEYGNEIYNKYTFDGWLTRVLEIDNIEQV